jgi:hypothetical protein
LLAACLETREAPVPGALTDVEAGAGVLASSTAVANERVERPEPGLARGRWEAPPAVFLSIAAATVVGGVALAIVRLRQGRR